MPSILCKVKEKAKETTAKRALKYFNNETGRILGAKSAVCLLCGRQQVSDARRKGKGKQEYDLLYAVMFTCKEGEGQKFKSPFVRIVTTAPFPMMVLAFNYTLDDLVRFFTGQKYCAFGTDLTFNLGNFKVTVTTYQHLLLQFKDDPSQKSPSLIGPIFIYICKGFAAYHFFTSFLVGQRPLN